MSDQQGQPPQWSPQQQYQQPSFYNQPTQASPGQFQPSPYSNFPPPRKRPGLWGWYKTRTRKMKIGLGCGTIIAILLFFACIGTAIGSNNLAAPPTPTPTATLGQAAVIISPTATLKPSPTLVLTQKPTIAPTHASQPTQPPHTPTPCPGINCNPWGYNFNAGNYIYSPPSAFCNYFSCISNFPNGRGYVVECHDGEYSKSGGIQGACSYHGGVWRPLYSH